MNEEDKELQKQLVDEMMKVSKTNPDVMIYMQVLMECYEDLEKELDQCKNNWEELKKLLNEMILDTKKPTVLNNREKMAIRSAIEHILNKMKELEEVK